VVRVSWPEHPGLPKKKRISDVRFEISWIKKIINTPYLIGGFHIIMLINISQYLIKYYEMR